MTLIRMNISTWLHTEFPRDVTMWQEGYIEVVLPTGRRLFRLVNL